MFHAKRKQIYSRSLVPLEYNLLKCTHSCVFQCGKGNKKAFSSFPSFKSFETCSSAAELRSGSVSLFSGVDACRDPSGLKVLSKNSVCVINWRVVKGGWLGRRKSSRWKIVFATTHIMQGFGKFNRIFLSNLPTQILRKQFRRRQIENLRDYGLLDQPHRRRPIERRKTYSSSLRWNILKQMSLLTKHLQPLQRKHRAEIPRGKQGEARQAEKEKKIIDIR